MNAKSLNLSVMVFSTAVLTGDTAVLIVKITEILLKSQLVEGWPVGYLQDIEELNSGALNTNPFSSRETDLNLGPPDYKSSTLAIRPRHL